MLGIAGLLLWRCTNPTGPPMAGMAPLLRTSILFALETVAKREEYLSHGDSWARMLCLAGVGLMLWGAASARSGKGLLETPLGWGLPVMERCDKKD